MIAYVHKNWHKFLMLAEKLQSLLTASLTGDSKAYSDFLTLASRMLRGFIAKRIAAAEVEDVLQEVLISLHKARHTYDGSRPALPWMLAIARFRLTDHLRKHYAGRQHLQVDIADFDNILHNDVTESSETSELVGEEVRTLPERQQKILHLLHTEGLTAKEAGQQLGMNESAVKVAAHRAYKQIRKKFLTA